MQIIIVSYDYSICLIPKMHLSWTIFDREVKYYIYCALLVRLTFNLKIFFNESITIETEVATCDLYLSSYLDGACVDSTRIFT